MNSVTTIEPHVPLRIFARHMARELSREEVSKVSGGRMAYTYCGWVPTGPHQVDFVIEADDCG